MYIKAPPQYGLLTGNRLTIVLIERETMKKLFVVILLFVSLCAGCAGAREISHNKSNINATQTEPTTTENIPKAEDFQLTPTVIEQACFGSAGCNVTVRIELAYTGTTANVEIIYDLIGADDPLRGRLEVIGTRYTIEEHYIMTSVPDQTLTVNIVAINPL